MQKFRIGDLVYYPRFSRNLCKIKEKDSCIGIYENKYNNNSLIGSVAECDLWTEVGSDDLCFESKTGVCAIIHATAENHSLLEQLYGVKFEAPPNQKTPKEVIQIMLISGWDSVPCIDVRYSNKFFANKLDIQRQSLDFLIPFDPKTGKAIIDYVDSKIITE